MRKDISLYTALSWPRADSCSHILLSRSLQYKTTAQNCVINKQVNKWVNTGGSGISSKLDARIMPSMSSSKGHQNHTEAKQSCLIASIAKTSILCDTLLENWMGGCLNRRVLKRTSWIWICIILGDFGGGFMEAGISSGLDDIRKWG